MPWEKGEGEVGAVGARVVEVDLVLVGRANAASAGLGENELVEAVVALDNIT